MSKFIVLGDNNSNFVIPTAYIQSVKAPKLSRDENDSLVVKIHVWVKDSKEVFTFSWQICEAEYEITTKKIWCGLRKKEVKTLVKYLNKLSMQTKEYADAVACYDKILQALGVSNESI